MCAFICVCSNFVSFLGCVFFCSRHEKQSETRSPAKQRLGPALVFCSKFEAVRSCSSSQPPLCGACLSCPFSAIAEKNNTKIAGGAQCAHEKLGRPPEEKKTKQGDAVCVLWVATPRVHHRKKKPWGPGRFQARPSRGSNPSFDRRQFLDKKCFGRARGKTTVSPRVPAAHFSRGSPPPLARKFLRRLLRRLGGFCEGFSEGRRARSCTFS